eukprot:380644-Amphidinium_carterae.1
MSQVPPQQQNMITLPRRREKGAGVWSGSSRTSFSEHCPQQRSEHTGSLREAYSDSHSEHDSMNSTQLVGDVLSTDSHHCQNGSFTFSHLRSPSFGSLQEPSISKPLRLSLRLSTFNLRGLQNSPYNTFLKN